jgi:hypothetical protein
MRRRQRTFERQSWQLTPDRVSWLTIGLASLGLIVTMFAR